MHSRPIQDTSFTPHLAPFIEETFNPFPEEEQILRDQLHHIPDWKLF